MPKFLIDDNSFPIEAFKEVSTQIVDGTSAHAESGAIDAELIRIATTDKAVQVEFGTAPVAETTNMYIPLGCVEYFRITRGNKVSILGGKVSITILE